MATKRRAILVFVSYSALAGSLAADNQSGMLQAIVKAFAGPHRFNYLFIENGTPYLDESSHLQLIEVRENQEDQTAQVSFFHQTETGKGLHFRYVIQADGNHVTLREFDARGTHRFDCVGTYQPEHRLLQCTAKQAPKPARDVDSPLTRQLGLFKRPTSWPAYESLDRHTLLRFYDWGFVHVQENSKVDAQGHTVARETGVISAMRVTSTAITPSTGH